MRAMSTGKATVSQTQQARLKAMAMGWQTATLRGLPWVSLWGLRRLR